MSQPGVEPQHLVAPRSTVWRMRVPPLPESIRPRPFAFAEAIDSGMTPQSLRSKRVRRLFRGVYVAAELDVTDDIRARAAVLVLPPDGALSHTSTLQRWGVDVVKK